MRPAAIRFLVVCAGVTLALGCGGGGDAPAATAPLGPRVVSTSLFSGPSILVFSQPAAWSPDGTRIAFEGAAAGASAIDIFTVSATGGTPVRATAYGVDPERGGECPAFLADGRLVYYRGWQGSDRNMHLMVASAAQAEDTPAATVLRSFNGSDVGLSANAAGSPETLTVSGDGLKAVATWTAGQWLLDWTAGPVAATEVVGGGGAVLSPEGTRLARVKDGNVVVRVLATGTETVVGPGADPSWATGGRLGYTSGATYMVVALDSGVIRTYAVSGLFQVPVLSPDASRVVYRSFGGANTGLSVGQLVD